MAGIALNVADSFVRGRQFALQRAVPRCFVGQAIQILERPADQQLSRRGRSWQVFDSVIDLEDQRIGQLSNLVESLLRARALFKGDVSFPSRTNDSSYQRDQCQGGG